MFQSKISQYIRILVVRYTIALSSKVFHPMLLFTFIHFVWSIDASKVNKLNPKYNGGNAILILTSQQSSFKDRFETSQGVHVSQ